MAFEIYNIMAVLALLSAVVIGWHQKATVEQALLMGILAAALAIAHRKKE